MAKSRKGSRKGSKKVYRKVSRKGSRKGSKKVYRKASKGGFRHVKKSTSMCSSLKRSVCSSNPNCRYVKRRGCFRKSGVAGGMMYEGPMLAPQYIR